MKVKCLMTPSVGENTVEYNQILLYKLSVVAFSSTTILENSVIPSSDTENIHPL